MEWAGAFDPGFVARYVLTQGHAGWLDLKYRDHGNDWVELELPWRQDLVGETGGLTLASGPIVSLMDMAAGMCIWQASGRFSPIATLDLRVDYMRRARDRASVIGRAACYKITRSAAFVRGTAHDGEPDDPIANVAAVFMTLEEKGHG